MWLKSEFTFLKKSKIVILTGNFVFSGSISYVINLLHNLAILGTKEQRSDSSQNYNKYARSGI